MITSFQFTTLGWKEYDRGLGRLAHEVKDWSRAFRHIASELSESVTPKHFKSRGRRGGDLWPKLKPSTLKAKKTKGQPRQPLVASGRMYAALTDQSHSDHLEEIDKFYMIWGVDLGTLPYALYHSTGASVRTKDGGSEALPRRRPVQLAKGDIRKITDVMMRTMRQKLYEAKLVPTTAMSPERVKF